MIDLSKMLDKMAPSGNSSGPLFYSLLNCWCG